MKRLLNSKKGINDVSIAFGIITIFVLIGLFLPFLNEEYNNDSPEIDVEGFQEDLGQDSNITSLSAFTIITSVFKMFFWTFGDLPIWLDSIFIVFRIILALIIARNVWIGGGA